MVAAMGGRGTGKSAWVTQQLHAARPPRFLLWDLMNEHHWCGPALQLGEAIRRMAGPSWALRVVPAPGDEARAAQFDLWCRAAMRAGQLGGPVTVWAEELAFVTRPSWAPAGWRELCLLGRHAGVTIYGTSQRPAQVDKDFFGNLDIVHCGRQTSEADARTMASLLGVRWQEMQTLPDLAWIERQAGDIEPRRGVLSFGGHAPAKKSAPAKRRGRDALGAMPEAEKLRPG